MALRPQIPVAVASPDADLAMIRQCGIRDVSLMLKPEELRDDAVAQAQERLARYDLTVSDAFCTPLQKNRSIHLGLPDRDEQIDLFSHMVRVLGRAHIPFTSIAWQPHGILRTDWRVGKHTRGGVSMYCDQAEILGRPNAEERAYTEEEIWDNFRYFLDRVIPVCEEAGVRMALHPNDRPCAAWRASPA